MKHKILLLFVLLSVGKAQSQSDLLMGDRHNVWDTINNVWKGGDSAIYYFDGQNRPTMEIHFVYNAGASRWDTTTRQDYTYHPTMGLLAFKHYFNYNAGVWDSSYREWYQYDPDSSLHYHSFFIHSGSAFVPSYRDEYNYNSFKKKTSYYYKLWNTGTSSYVNSTLTTYIYNGLQQNDTLINQTWNGSAWVNSNLTAYQYNAQGLVSTKTGYNWSTLLSTWANGLRWTYTYNASQKINQELFFPYMPASMTWTVYSKTDYFYVNDLYLSQMAYSIWDQNTAWSVFERTDYTLNADNNPSIIMFFRFNSTTYLMDLTQYTTFDYDADRNISHDLYQERVNHLGIVRYKREDFYWYLLSFNGIENITSAVSVNIFPNPAAQTISIQFVLDKTEFIRLSLFNSTGSLIKNIASRNETAGNVLVQTDVSTLPCGIYFLQTSIGSKTKTQKIIIEH